MSDPQPTHLGKKPPRAEPLQPDQPGQGGGQAGTDDPASDAASRADEKALEREKTAQENVSKGYD